MPATWKAEPDVFITFEGLDGSGKTTQVRLLADSLEAEGARVLLTREPGGTQVGDEIRQVLHRIRTEAMQAEAELLLYSAARAQIVRQVIRPALAAGTIVIADRYADSTLAYQGYGRQLDLATLNAITAFATGGLKPDITFYLDVPTTEGLRRREDGHAQHGEEYNRMDRQTEDFYERVHAGYMALIRAEPGRWITVNAMRPVDEIQADLRAHMAARLHPRLPSTQR